MTVPENKVLVRGWVSRILKVHPLVQEGLPMSRVLRWNQLLTGGLAILGLTALLGACLLPVWFRWSDSVVGPFGGIDVVMQAGLLQWSAHTWWHPGIWINLPIFHPVPGAIGFMDSLLGQAWLVWPVAALFNPTAAALYNTAFLGSLILSALGMAFLYRASGGRWWASPVAALILLGAPYTAAQLGHLNQLPPPFVLFSFGALIAALRRQDAGLPTTRWWWLLALFLVLQAAWGWYGFAYATIGVAVLKFTWLVHRSRGRTLGWSLVFQVVRRALFPFILATIGVLVLAQPQLKLADRYSSFSRADQEVRQGSADIQHFLNRGAYRSGPADWFGQGQVGLQRYEGRARQVLHPGWLALALAGLGWWRRGYLPFQQRRLGRALLVLGVVGLVLSFGDSIGVPFTSWRVPLPLDALRELIPPFKAFRAAWRFSWLMVIAMSWWSAVAVQQMVERQGHRQVRSWGPPLLIVVLTLLSLPVQVPAVDLEVDGRLLPVGPTGRAAVLTLPAPANEFAEDQTEARWLLRAMSTGRATTGGTSGWEPPEVAELRRRLAACEKGQSDASALLTEMRLAGYGWVELALRPGDGARLDFWRSALNENGARRLDDQPHVLYETYRLD
jgi:hypothetical protein